MRGTCNLCGWPVVHIPVYSLGARCIRCFSSFAHRAMGAMIEGLHLQNDSRIYELSSRGAFLRYLTRRFQEVYVSEYFDDVPRGEMKNGIPCQDIQNLTLDDESFDLVTSTEVFEHVPDDTKGFAEIYRVLRHGGHFVFTVPLWEDRRTVERAVMRPNGSVEHIREAKYHHDRVRGRFTVLVFRDYGGDIIEKLEFAGFSAEIRRISLPQNGIEDARVIVCRKPI